MYNRSDVIYRYDGTFDGFLCCVFAAVYAGILPADILDGDTLLPARTIETEPDKAARVAAGIEKKIAPAAHDLVRTAFGQRAAPFALSADGVFPRRRGAYHVCRRGRGLRAPSGKSGQ